MVSAFLGVAGMAVIPSCTAPTAGPEERVAVTSSDLWTNGGFETGGTGTVPAAPWVVQTFLNQGITVQTPQTVAGLKLQPGGVARTTILHAAGGPGTMTDPDLGATASLRWPRYGNQCAIVNGQGTGNNHNVNTLSQTMTIAAGDVDPADGLVHVRFAVAPVLQNPAHLATQQPYYMVVVTNVTSNTILYSDFNLSGAGIPWKTINGGTANEIDYTDWQLVDVAPGNAALAVGNQVTLEVIAAGCSLGAHYGELYVDGVGAVIPGISVEGTGPAQANAGANITYTLTYRNGGAVGETGVVVSLVTPAGTTFQAVTAPGLVCVKPAVGATGTVTCTIGNLAAGATGTFTITVNIDAATTGTVVEAGYQIDSTQEPEPLVGPAIDTLVGCTADANCLAGNWCDEATAKCTPTLANASPMPSDPPHKNPPLNATCTAAAATLVCTTGVCDPNGNVCGIKLGDPGCTTTPECIAGVCITTGTNKDKCEPCASDTSCAAPTPACNTTTDQCVQCTQTNTTACTGTTPVCAATDTCVACNGDNGTTATEACSVAEPYCSGTGACIKCTTNAQCTTGTHPGPICNTTTGACTTTCTTDAQCGAGNWCDEALGKCTPTLPNATPIPTDGPHTNPTLNGTCTAAAAKLVCTATVCDPNGNLCGIKLGDPGCTTTPECIAGVCITTGPNLDKCEPCASDTNCATPTPACNLTTNDCVQCTQTSSTACTGTTPLCGATDTCVACNGDNGTTATETCPVAGPYCAGTGACIKCTANSQCTTGTHPGPICNTTTGACGNTCTTDAQCGAGNWCDEAVAKCTPTLPNATPIPTDGPHTNPTLNGTCTAAAATLVCASGVCDPTGNVCGIELGDPGCTTTPECINGVCITTGPNTGKCEPCAGDISCEAPTPACDPTSNTCVQCTTTNGTACTGMTPVCSATDVCVQCVIDANCPTGTCNPVTNTCTGGTMDAGVDAGMEAGVDAGLDSGMVAEAGVDSSMVAEAGVDAGPIDAGADVSLPEASADSAAPPVDSGADTASPEADASDTGTVAGGGCSCKTAGTSDDTASGGAMRAALGGLGLMMARRRRKSA